MKTADIAWAAGVIEGEGCFVFSKDKRSSHHKTAIQVEMTDKDIIDRLHGLFGGKVYMNTSPSKKLAFPNAKDSWRWVVARQSDVFDTLLRIVPYMGQRRLSKAKELLEYLEPKVCR